MIQYTDLTLSLIVEGIDLTSATSVWVTISDKPGAIVVTDDSPTVTAVDSDTAITANFAQAETGLFFGGTVGEVQVNYIISGKRHATLPTEIKVVDNLIKEVLT